MSKFEFSKRNENGLWATVSFGPSELTTARYCIQTKKNLSRCTLCLGYGQMQLQIYHSWSVQCLHKSHSCCVVHSCSLISNIFLYAADVLEDWKKHGNCVWGMLECEFPTYMMPVRAQPFSLTKWVKSLFNLHHAKQSEMQQLNSAIYRAADVLRHRFRGGSMFKHMSPMVSMESLKWRETLPIICFFFGKVWLFRT